MIHTEVSFYKDFFKCPQKEIQAFSSDIRNNQLLCIVPMTLCLPEVLRVISQSPLTLVATVCYFLFHSSLMSEFSNFTLFISSWYTLKIYRYFMYKAVVKSSVL